MISEIDSEIGALRLLLEEKGIAGNTIIIFMGDNGYYLGERQLAGKWLMHENSLRVPLIVYDPRVKKHREISDMVLNIDIAATILDIGGADRQHAYQGTSLLPYLENRKPELIRKEILVEHLWELAEIPSSEGIRTEKWKYFRYRFIDAHEELYDLIKDPMETVNLANDPEYSKTLHKLRSKCNSEIEKYTRAKL